VCESKGAGSQRWLAPDGAHAGHGVVHRAVATRVYRAGPRNSGARATAGPVQQRASCNRSTYVGQSGGGNAKFPTLPRVDTAALPRGGAAGHDAVPWHSKIPLNLKYSGASVSQATFVSGNDRPWR